MNTEKKSLKETMSKYRRNLTDYDVKEPTTETPDTPDETQVKPSNDPFHTTKPPQQPDTLTEGPKLPSTPLPSLPQKPTTTMNTTTATEEEMKKCSVDEVTCGKCGVFPISVVGQRVINGADASRGEFPYHVMLQTRVKKDKYTCGGSIIHAQWVLSAAHCFIWQSDGKMVRVSEVVVGGGSIYADKLDKLTVDTVITHPDFKDVAMGDDIALVKLSEKIDFNSNRHLQPICLGEEGDTPLADKAVATGWGRLVPKGGSVYPNKLQEVSLGLIPANKCKGVSLPKNKSKVVCAMTPYKDTCQGDSGGPLVAQIDDGRWTQVGITSYGYGCARPDTPGVYVRVAHYLPWIEETTGICAC